VDDLAKQEFQSALKEVERLIDVARTHLNQQQPRKAGWIIRNGLRHAVNHLVDTAMGVV